jgi:hypothetical protein
MRCRHDRTAAAAGSHAKPPSPATPPRPPEARAARPEEGHDYVFKIAPADPKTTSDFEDVADK